VPIGTGVFTPRGQFAFPRSYVRGIVFNIAGYTVTDHGNHYSWNEIGGSVEFFIFLDLRFRAWNSNRWTLDHVVTEFYHTLTPGGTQFPDDFSLFPFYHPTTHQPFLQFRFGTVDFGALVYFDFPAASPFYWFPPH